MTLFLATYACILSSCYDGNAHTHATTNKLKKIHDKYSGYKSRNWHPFDLPLEN